jgi:hypothetical protein
MNTPLPKPPRSVLHFIVGLSVGVVVTVTTLTYFSIKVASALLDCVPQKEVVKKPQPKTEQRL